jgi:hypothetical protein
MQTNAMQHSQANQFLFRYDCLPTVSEEGPVISFFEKDAVRKFARTVLPFIGILLIGLLLIRYPENCRFGEFVRALRDALMIAGLIGIGIELWSVSVLVDHATDRVSERLVGYGLPRAAQELIHNLVHKTKRVYRDYRVIYRIEPHSTDADRVIVRSTLSYKVVNNGMGAEPYTPLLAEERMYDPKVLSLEYGSRRYGEQDLERSVSETGVVTFSVGEKVRIIPSNASASIETLNADQYCFVRWEFDVEMRNYYSAVIAFLGVTINPVVEIQGSEGFDFSATMGDCVHALGGHTWEYKRAFIGGQHIRVWWKPRERVVGIQV